MAEYYVNKSGNDGNSGVDHANAWASIQHAIDTISSSDTIWVGSGVYEENLTYPGSNKTFDVKADGYVTLDGTSIGGNLVNSGSSQYWYPSFYNFVIKGYSYIGPAYQGVIPRYYYCDIENCGISFNNKYAGVTHDYQYCILKDVTITLNYYASGIFSLKHCTCRNITWTYAQGGPRHTTFTLALESDDFDSHIYIYQSVNDYAVLSSLDYCNVRDKITYKGTEYANLATFQAAYPTLASHSINQVPDFNDDLTLRWSSPNIGNGEAGTDIGAKGPATYYTSTDDLFDGALLSNISRDENGDFKLDVGQTSGTITSAVLDFGGDVTLNEFRWLSDETYPADVVDYDKTDTAPNRRNFEYRIQTNAQGSFGQSDPTPSWQIAERDDDLSLTCQYFQVRFTLRNDGVAA